MIAVIISDKDMLTSHVKCYLLLSSQSCFTVTHLRTNLSGYMSAV